MTTFESLNLSPRLLETLTAEGYVAPTPIQAGAIPPVLEGRDLLGCAQTGTGKTAAFALPLIEVLLETRGRGAPRPRALVLAPTRELAGQIEDSLRTYGRGTGLRAAVIYGGVKQSHQVRALRAGVDAIVATPGRLLDLIEQGHVDLSTVEMLVLDEADRMLDMGFIQPIRRIAALLPEDRQTLLFSATMPPKIRELAETLLDDPVSVSVTPVASAAPLIEQELYHIADEHKPALLIHLLRDPGVERSVVFTKTKCGAEKLAKVLNRDGLSAGAIHGNKSQSQRQRALDSFRAGRSRVLVATDVAARGLDVDGITHVFNFNLPNEPEAYVHRIGRTGRAGAAGRAVSFCSRAERGFLRSIERLTGDRIETSRAPEQLGIADDRPAEKAPPRPARKPRREKPASGPKRNAPSTGKAKRPSKKKRRATSPNAEAAPIGRGVARGRGTKPAKRADASPR